MLNENLHLNYQNLIRKIKNHNFIKIALTLVAICCGIVIIVIVLQHFFLGKYSPQSRAASKYVGYLGNTSVNRCDNTQILCYRIWYGALGTKKIFAAALGKKVKKDMDRLIGRKVRAKGIDRIYTKQNEAKEKIPYLLITTIECLDCSTPTPTPNPPTPTPTVTPPPTKKAVEFSSQTALTIPNSWGVYNNLNVNYILGRMNQNDGSAANLKLVIQFGLKKYIPLTVSYPPNATLLAQLKQADPANAPEYAVCFNEENTLYHIGWDIATTEKYLVACIDGFKAVWPNVKIIVNLGSQADRVNGTITDYFPNWPLQVWPALANHMDEIYGFGLHYYPTYTCKTKYEENPNYPYHSPPTDWPHNPDAVNECVRRYIQAARELMQSKGVSKPLMFTEFGMGNVNTETWFTEWKEVAAWNKLWRILQENNIEFVTIYATVYFADGTKVFNPVTQCPNTDVNSANSLAYPCRNMELTPYGQAFSQISRPN